MHASAPALRTHILMVDDMKLCRLIRDFLEPMGYQMAAAHTGPQGVEMALQQPFAALILDVMMPGMDGLAVLRRFRKSSSVPVLMLTGRGEESRRSMAVPAGQTGQSPPLIVGDLRVPSRIPVRDPADQTLQLTAVEFDLLFSLAKAAGRVKTCEQLLLEVADRYFDILDRSIDVHISSIWKKLGDDPRCPCFIATIRNAGYMTRKPGSEAVV
jgi:DNA-binding response OmpR family regulator